MFHEFFCRLPVCVDRQSLRDFIQRWLSVALGPCFLESQIFSCHRKISESGFGRRTCFSSLLLQKVMALRHNPLNSNPRINIVLLARGNQANRLHRQHVGAEQLRGHLRGLSQPDPQPESVESAKTGPFERMHRTHAVPIHSRLALT